MLTLIMLPGASALGQSITQLTAQEETLAEKVTNPVAPLLRVTAEDAYSPSLWNTPGEENQAEGLLAVPFTAFATPNLARIKIFFDTSSSDGTHGVSELQIFDVMLLGRNRETFAVGITSLLRPETFNHRDTLAPGPALAAVIKSGKWKYGLFNQNFLSNTFAQTQLQPVLSRGLGKKWSAEIGDAQYTYDWKKHRVTSLPLSGQLNRILTLAYQDIHLFFRAQYNLKNESGSDKWTLTAGFSLIMHHQQ